MNPLHTCLVLLCFLHQTGPVTSASAQHEFEWVSYGEVAKYTYDIAFSLVAFTIPPHTLKAEFRVILFDEGSRKLLLSLRKKGIPVLQAYNETLPESYILPSDQQIFEYEKINETNIYLTLNSPASGRVFLVATELCSLAEVIAYLQWGQQLGSGTIMSVEAQYTIQSSVRSIAVEKVTKVSSAEGLKQIYSFRLPSFTMSYSVTISNCRHGGGSEHCPVTMMTAASLALHDKTSVSVDCHRQTSQCQLTVTSPALEQDHYVTFSFEDGGKDETSGKNETVSFDVRVDVQECTIKAQLYSDWYWMFIYHRNQDSQNVNASDRRRAITLSAYRNITGIAQGLPGFEEQNPLCLNLGYLGPQRYPNPNSGSSFSFDATFGPWNNDSHIGPEFHVAVPDFTTEVRTFSLQDSQDTGGVLHIDAFIMKKDWQGVVWVCAMPHRVAQNGSVDQCPEGALLTLNTTATNGTKRRRVFGEAFLPYPISGSWYMSMQSQCSGPKPCEMLPLLTMSVRVEQCAPNDCGHYGHCQMYTDANVVFSGCECYAGYRGLLCEDDTYSLTDAEQLRAVYLLALSNLSFVPAICLAVYRCFFTLAAIFLFNGFFSAFYHACDTSHVFLYCILDYETLAFCDFYGSVLSFYATVLYMAKIPDSCRSFLLMMGALIIAVFQNNDRHSNVGHILPLTAAGLIMIVSWIVVMCKRKRLYPSKRRYLFFLLPGFVLAIAGIGVNYGFMWNKSTYQYTHSFWHFALMVTPCFLMPPRSRGISGCKRGLSVSAQDIIRIGNHQQSERLLGQQDDDEPAMFDASMNSITTDRNRLI